MMISLQSAFHEKGGFNLAIFKLRKKGNVSVPVLASNGSLTSQPFSLIDSYLPSKNIQYDLYDSLREAVPVIDAAIYKIVRLTGGFRVETADKRMNRILDEFVKDVSTDAGQSSLQTFIDTYFEQLLTYGIAVGEMITDEDGKVKYLYNADCRNITLKRNSKSFNEVDVCSTDGITETPAVHQERIVYSTLNANAGSLTGNSILKGLPFVSSVLLKIFNSVGQNWERIGNVRFAVTYKPGEDGASKAYAKERALTIADEWGKAMKSSEVRDFIAVGDVEIKTIGADNQILDSEIPVKQMLEQIIAKLSLPPFMLGLSWSTTERMSQQQADTLTSELEFYRRILTPVIKKICKMHLRAYGYTKSVNVVWDDITLKDMLDEANARYLNAKADEIYGLIDKKKEEGYEEEL